MSDTPTKLIPSSVWSVVIAVLAVAVVLLLVNDRRPEPSVAFRYEVGDFQKVDPSQIIFRESGKLTPGLDRVSALSAGSDERIYVAGDNTIVVYDLDGTEVERIALAGTPDCIAVASDGDILLGMRSHVEVVDMKGETKALWEDFGQRSYMTSIAVGENEVYVADAGRRIVLRFDRSGKLLGHIGEKDEAREVPGFIVPGPFFDVALDDEGALWVVNPGRLGLESYRSNGDLITSRYRPSMAVEDFCGCYNPVHIAFRKNGSLVTGEKGLARVKVYEVDESFAGLVAGPDSFPKANIAALSSPSDKGTPIQDLAVDARDRVLVLDPHEKTVRIFERKEGGA